MLKADQIPNEAVEAAARMLCHERHPCWSIVAEVMETDHDGQATEFRILARASIAAALNAWPGMWVEQLYPLPVDTQGIILPLPQESNNAEG